jgi:hypothetical protein
MQAQRYALQRDLRTRPQAMGRRRILIIVVLLVGALLAYAWIDGGREPLRQISEPVPLPEDFQ